MTTEVGSALATVPTTTFLAESDEVLLLLTSKSPSMLSTMMRRRLSSVRWGALDRLSGFYAKH